MLWFLAFEDQHPEPIPLQIEHYGPKNTRKNLNKEYIYFRVYCGCRQLKIVRMKASRASNSGTIIQGSPPNFDSNIDLIQAN